MIRYLVLSLFLLGCTEKQKDLQLEGTPVDGDVKAYTEMCQRQPESNLCRKE